jgi:hypothetical protein
MHSLIEKLLFKRGIKDLKELDNEEKQTFDTWQSILSKEELKMEDVKQFCQSQIDIIENKWKDYNTDNAKKSELIPYHTCYKTLLLAIDSPRSARENLENQLLQMIK